MQQKIENESISNESRFNFFVEKRSQQLEQISHLLENPKYSTLPVYIALKQLTEKMKNEDEKQRVANGANDVIGLLDILEVLKPSNGERYENTANDLGNTLFCGNEEDTNSNSPTL